VIIFWLVNSSLAETSDIDLAILDQYIGRLDVFVANSVLM